MDSFGRFEKLIRDHIPEIAGRSERKSFIRYVDDISVKPFVAYKILAEAFEILDTIRKDDRESLAHKIADLMELIDRLTNLAGIGREAIKNIRDEKLKAYGGFNANRLISLENPDPIRIFTNPVRPLGQAIKYHLMYCKRAHLAVAFVMSSGVKFLVNSLAAALARGAKIRILTTDYLGVTEPDALDQLIKLPGDIDVRLYSEPGRSYHPKAYFFEYADDNYGVAFIGSSNLSRSALENGVEWNYEIRETDHGWPLREFIQHFDRLFEGIHSRPVTPTLIENYRNSRRPQNLADEENLFSPPIYPRPAQAEALAQLEMLRADGQTHGLVIAATGIGKTYLAAFDSAPFLRVLFVAHREELLIQAETAFRVVRPHDQTGFYIGNRRDEEADCLFATVQTLGRQTNLSQFSPDRFDYLVIDEFHHAAANSYQAILNHFRPRFLLGLTATPYRADNRDIFALCNGNVAYQLNFIEAISFGWLCPFRYFGIYDDIDYETIPWRNHSYDEAVLESALSTQKRAKAVLEAYRQYPGRAAIGFCASVSHAEFMSHYFNAHGVRALAVHSGLGSPPRKNAIEILIQGAVEILFTVDLFNEGIDIPIVDRVLFLRPTESITVFLQQLGRGLRIYHGKEYLTVLDFIGNYRKAHYKLALLAGRDNEDMEAASRKVIEQFKKGKLTEILPAGIEIHFDLKAIDLIDHLSRQQDPLRQRLISNYQEVKTELGRRPSLIEMHFYGCYDVRRYRQIFGSWYGFLLIINELTIAEETLEQEVGPVLREIEKIDMTNSYKMVMLESFVQNSGLDNPVNVKELARDFRNFFINSRHRKDIIGTEVENIDVVDESTIVAYLNNILLDAWNNIAFFHYDPTRGMFAYTGPQPVYKQVFENAMLERIQFRLTDYFERRFERHNVFSVIQAGSRGIIMLGNDPKDQVPRGRAWKVVLIDGERFYAKFAKVAINVLKEKPNEDRSIPNRLTDVLEHWFGKGRYLSKYNNRVRITIAPNENDVWLIEPLRRKALD